jgi:hypothetical protein
MISPSMRRPEVSKNYSKPVTLTSAEVAIQTAAYLKLGGAVETVTYKANKGYQKVEHKLTRQQNIDKRRNATWAANQARKEAQQ